MNQYVPTDERTGARVFFKCENLQRAGAFKFRGAYNALSQLDGAKKKRGVVAYSSGNHAQAVALAGRELGIRATIVMPQDAPAVKLEATRGYGAEVHKLTAKGFNEKLAQWESPDFVAIARAFVNRPMILIADEPTGNLDPATSVDIMKLLDRINATGTTVLMATHDHGIVDQMRKRVIELDTGRVVRDEARGVYGFQH